MADLSRLKLSKRLRSKLEFYRKAGTLKAAGFSGIEMRRITKFLRNTSSKKITAVTDLVRSQIQRTLADAHANQLPFISVVNRLVAETDLNRGIYSSVRKRAAVIATNELHRARTASMFAHAVDQGYTYFVWVSVLMATTCPICAGRHGKTRTWENWLKVGIPPAPHINCKCTLVPGREIPIPREPIQRTVVKRMGIMTRMLRQAPNA